MKEQYLPSLQAAAAAPEPRRSSLPLLENSPACGARLCRPDRASGAAGRREEPGAVGDCGWAAGEGSLPQPRLPALPSLRRRGDAAPSPSPGVPPALPERGGAAAAGVSPPGGCHETESGSRPRGWRRPGAAAVARPSLAPRPPEPRTEPRPRSRAGPARPRTAGSGGPGPGSERGERRHSSESPALGARSGSRAAASALSHWQN